MSRFCRAKRSDVGEKRVPGETDHPLHPSLTRAKPAKAGRAASPRHKRKHSNQRSPPSSAKEEPPAAQGKTLEAAAPAAAHETASQTHGNEEDRRSGGNIDTSSLLAGSLHESPGRVDSAGNEMATMTYASSSLPVASPPSRGSRGPARRRGRLGEVGVVPPTGGENTPQGEIPARSPCTSTTTTTATAAAAAAAAAGSEAAGAEPMFALTSSTLDGSPLTRSHDPSLNSAHQSSSSLCTGSRVNQTPPTLGLSALYVDTSSQPSTSSLLKPQRQSPPPTQRRLSASHDDVGGQSPFMSGTTLTRPMSHTVEVTLATPSTHSNTFGGSTGTRDFHSSSLTGPDVLDSPSQRTLDTGGHPGSKAPPCSATPIGAATGEANTEARQLPAPPPTIAERTEVPPPVRKPARASPAPSEAARDGTNAEEEEEHDLSRSCFATAEVEASSPPGDDAQAEMHSSSSAAPLTSILIAPRYPSSSSRSNLVSATQSSSTVTTRPLPRVPPAHVPTMLDNHTAIELQKHGVLLSTAFGQRTPSLRRISEALLASPAGGEGTRRRPDVPLGEGDSSFAKTGDEGPPRSRDAMDTFRAVSPQLSRGSSVPDAGGGVSVDSYSVAIPEFEAVHEDGNASFSFLFTASEHLSVSGHGRSSSSCNVSTTGQHQLSPATPLALRAKVAEAFPPSPATPAFIPSILQRGSSGRSMTSAGGSFRMGAGGYRKSEHQEEEMEQSFQRASALIARMNQLRQSGEASPRSNNGSPRPQGPQPTGSAGGPDSRLHFTAPGLPSITVTPFAGAAADRSPSPSPSPHSTGTNPLGEEGTSASPAPPMTPQQRDPSAGSLADTPLLLQSPVISHASPTIGMSPRINSSGITLPQILSPPVAAVGANPRRSSVSIFTSSREDCSASSGNDGSCSPSPGGSPRSSSAAGSGNNARRRRSDVSFIGS